MSSDRDSRQGLLLPVAMEAERLRVFEALTDVHPDLGRWYYGAVHVLEDTTNPEAPYQAAHSLRDLMEKLPKYRDVPVAGGSSGLKAAAQNVERWLSARLARHEPCPPMGCALEEGEIAGHLGALQMVLDSGMTRFAEAGAALRSFDPAGAPVDELTVRAWHQVRGRAAALCHHNGEVSVEAVRALLDEFGNLFLSRAIPAPADDLVLIDEILSGSEGA